MTAACQIIPAVGTIYTIGSWSADDYSTSGFQDAAGNYWSVTSETGLLHTPAMRTNVIDREQSDGEFDGDVWVPGRSITLEGTLRSLSMPALYTAMRQLRGLLVAGSRRQTLVAAFPDLTLQCLVRKDGETLIDKEQHSQPLASWSLVLYAPDPNLYGGTLQSASTTVFVAFSGRAYPLAFPRAYGSSGTAGTVSVTNNGDVTTYPVITISAGAGPMVNPTITAFGGLSLVFNLSLNAGDVLTIDTGQRTVTLNGTAARTWPLITGTLGCPPGVTQLLFNAFSADPTATMSATWRDAYA